jgi:sulfoxide reductase heme-binding subunit YedZ
MLTSRWSKPLLFLLCLAPLAVLLWRGYRQDLGANPLEFITHSTGDWTLRFLLVSLAVTPLRRLARIPELIRFRRMLGLFAFFYGSLHLLTYLWFDQFFDFAGILKDVAKRPFITAGMAAFLAMAPLAATSTAGWIRRLGGRNWQRLHRLAYLAALAGVTHYYWLVKSDVRRPLMYAAIAAALLLARLPVRRLRPAV